ncbi:MAG: hypothetical protein AB1714_07610 [Acidobacteriota bacterium]
MYEAEAMDRMGSVLMELGEHSAARKALTESYRIGKEVPEGFAEGCTFLPDNALCDLAMLNAREGDLVHALIAVITTLTRALHRAP